MISGACAGGGIMQLRVLNSARFTSDLVVVVAATAAVEPLDQWRVGGRLTKRVLI
jgi:hypothetical protein